MRVAAVQRTGGPQHFNSNEYRRYLWLCGKTLDGFTKERLSTNFFKSSVSKCRGEFNAPAPCKGTPEWVREIQVTNNLSIPLTQEADVSRLFHFLELA